MLKRVKVNVKTRNLPVSLLYMYMKNKHAVTDHLRPIYECRCDDRLKPKGEESTRLTYSGLLGELEHLKIETRLIDEKFASVMGECVI
jgi:hypothetical protein